MKKQQKQQDEKYQATSEAAYPIVRLVEYTNTSELPGAGMVLQPLNPQIPPPSQS